MPLNKQLLRKVEQHIMAEPQRLRMDSWAFNREISHSSDDPNKLGGLSGGYGEPTWLMYPVCGIVGCIAGWMVILDRNFPPANDMQDINFEEAAEALLGEHFRPFNLFYVDMWPDTLYERFHHATEQEERAKIVCEAIETYITMSDKQEAHPLDLSHQQTFYEDDDEYGDNV